MRTKALLLTAALSAAGVATSMAQVYSVNAVGYVNRSVNPGLAIVANPLNGTNNNLNTILPLAPDGSQDGVTIYRFNVAQQNYSDAIQWVGGFGWFSANINEDYTINPGEAFFLQNSLAGPLNITFVGDVPQGSLHNPFPGANNLALRSSQVPQEAPIGDPSQANTLGFPAMEGDTLYLFNPVTQSYKNAYQFVNGFGWFSANADDPGPAGPTIPVATGFFVQGVGALSRSWDRTFSVN
jgi:hypothetical protein